MSSGRMSVREPNAEVLRCALMFMIVVGHCCLCGYGEDRVALVMCNLTTFSVNAFVLISGWYSIKFNVRKIFSLLGQGVFASIVLLLMSPFVTGGGVWTYSLGWFGCSYLGLMVVAPLINGAFDRVEHKDVGSLLLIWLIYFVLVTSSWLNLNAINVYIRPYGWASHSFNTLVFMYVTGRMLRVLKFVGRFSKRALFATLVVCEVLIIAWLYGGRMFCSGCLSVLFGAKGSDYQSPFVIAASVSVFALFMQIRFPPIIGRLCSFAAPSMFSVYLLHNAMNYQVSSVLMADLLKMFAWSDTWLSVTLSVCLSATVIYFVCLILDLMRRILYFLIINK